MRFAFPLLLLATAAFAAEPPLPGTKPLAEQSDLSEQMVAGISRWLDRETTRAAEERQRSWEALAKTGFTENAVQQKRAALRRMIGAVDPTAAGALEEIVTAGETQPQPNAAGVSQHRVRWAALDGVHGTGLLLRPLEAKAFVLFVPDADETPADCAAAHQLAASGCLVLIPQLIDRDSKWSGSELLQRFTNQPHREWLHRQAFELGRTLIGLEVEKLLAAIDAVARTPRLNAAELPIGIVGRGEGALLALHAAALDQRIRTTLLTGYFGSRDRLFEEPIYRNVFGLLREFGDAQLAALIAPRTLLIDSSPALPRERPTAPAVSKQSITPGKIAPPAAASAERELKLARAIQPTLQATSFASADGGSRDALKAFADSMSVAPQEVGNAATNLGGVEFTTQQQRELVREIESTLRRLMREEELGRTREFWSKVKPGAEWENFQAQARERLWRESIGRIDDARLPAQPRSRVLFEREKWTAHEVQLDVFPDVFAWAWVLLPRDLKPGERRPVVVCQHGLEGLPQDVVTEDPASNAFKAYKAFAARLADRGYIVVAPHNPYRGGDTFRVLQRKANPLGLSLFSFITAQHEALTEWLAKLPFVDSERIAFYGLSYGGKSAMRLPALIPRYCLSICSGDFNEWIHKNVSTDLPMSYVFTGEYEMPEWNLASTANYAEMAMLIAPRPFMVERGHDDGVGLNEWVGYEFAKVRRGFDKLGIGNRAEIEWFDGPHTIHSVGTFDFLQRHLRWTTK